MEDSSPLHSLVLVEQDHSGERMVTWSFPVSSHDQEIVLKNRTAFDETEPYFSRFDRYWTYSYSWKFSSPSTLNPRVGAFCVHLQTRAFHPERFSPLVRMIAAAYAATGEPTKMMELFMLAFRRDAVSLPEEASALGVPSVPRRWELATEPEDSAFHGRGRLAGLVRLLGDHAVLLWSAMLLRRRVVVYAPGLSDLQQAVRALPSMMPQRGRAEWDHLRPWLSPRALHASMRTEEDAQAELEDLRGAGWFVAGVTSPAAASEAGWWDLFVDLPGHSCTVAEGARGSFVLTSLHRNLASSMARVLDECSGTEAEEAMANAIRKATDNIIHRLRGLLQTTDEGGSPVRALSPDIIRSRGKVKQTNMLTFLWEVAQAEPSIPTVVMSASGVDAGAEEEE